MDGSTSKRQEYCVTGKEDRISELPDSILCHILSSLPTLSCVRTSCLSRRWRYLWISVPALHFHYLDFPFQSRTRNPANASESFEKFVNTVFIRRTNPSIRRFCLHLPVSCANRSTSYINSWILAACTDNVEELEIIASFAGINLPHILFNSKKLVTLKLSSSIALKVPEFVNLPSLKVMHLQYQSCPSFTYLNRIISGCPALEDLAIDTSRNLNDFQTLSILSSSLKRFELRNCCNAFYSVNLIAAQLQIFHLTDEFSLKPQIKIKNVSSIRKATFDFAYCGCLSSKTRFFKLFLTPEANTVYKRQFWVNLTQLVLRYCAADLGTFPIILECFPTLEDLELKYQNCNHVIPYEALKEKHEIYCLKHSLKILKIRSFEGKETEMRTTEYFLKNAQVLKEIRIHTEKELEGEVLKKLLMFRRCSQTCQVAVVS